ncbi:hypothetical protein AB0I94_29415 [Streptomyces sp. NPDC050147]|uniref:hypothetical protein n=1 Tax=Streptomyces sp. NPDC050147 TaxID=3155513 RepID=UPI00344AD1D1
MSPPSADPEPADDDQDSLLEDLLAPFDRVRMPRPSVPLDDTDGMGDAGEPDTPDALDAPATGTPGNLDDADGAADEAQRVADEAQDSPPPPPASARFPDVPPPSATTRTSARPADPAPDPVPSPPLPSAPPHVEAPDVAERRTAEYRLRPPMPPVPPPDPTAAGIPGQPPRPTSEPVADPAGRAAAGPAEKAEPWSAPDAGLSPPPPASEPRPVREARTPAAPPAHAHRLTPKPVSTATPPHTTAASPRTAAARRAVGAVDLTPGPGAGGPFVSFARPALYDDSTTRLRPVRTWAQPRVSAAAACVVLGLGLIGGAATGSWLTGGSEGTAPTRTAYAVAGELWHSVPVDQLFPATIKGEGAGPGGADRTWTRVAVAPDTHCRSAFDPLLRKALAPAGCLRLLRATYTDATRSHVTTVGLLFTKADAEAMSSLRTRFTEEGLDRRPDLMPRPYAAKGTPAGDFGDAQRASWTVSVLPDAPVVAFAVSGFADGRTVTEPEPADEAMKTSATSAPAQAGLGHEAKGIADRVERRLRKAIAATEKPS